jgi:flagellar biosynthesis chaperone FliJ
MANLRQQLMQTEKHLARLRSNIARQEALVDELRRTLQDTTKAEELLAILRDTYEVKLAERAQIVNELGLTQPEA